MRILSVLIALGLTLNIGSAVASEGMSYEVKVKGMTCDACKAKVETELGKLKDIEPGTVKVELDKNMAHLTIKKTDAKTKKAIIAAVEKAGFKVDGQPTEMKKM